MTAEFILQLEGVGRVFGQGIASVTALEDVNLSVRSGELVAIMGTSGSGKSTLLSIAGGLDTPTAGEVFYDGRSLRAMSARALARLRRRSLGYVFQDFNLIPTLSAMENVCLPLELDGWRVAEARSAAKDALRSVDLADLGSRYPEDLSGGQRQRVAIARAIVGPRNLILADEPTGALDSATGEAVLAVLRKRVDAGAGGVLVTHDAGFAAWADRIVFLKDGRIIDESRPLEAIAPLPLGGA
jgi:putative ABC transport system ATP-binding protein